MWLLFCALCVGVCATTSIANLTAVTQTWSIPIHVNVFLLGLDGTGHLGVNIPQDRLQHWLVDTNIKWLTFSPRLSGATCLQRSGASGHAKRRTGN